MNLRIAEIYFEGYVNPYRLDDLEYLLKVADNSSDDVILFNMRSPGGSVYKVAETARLIESVATHKPIVAYTDVMIASAAYWLACSCDRIYAAPGADIGSVGVFAETFDFEQKYKMNGIDHKVFRAQGSPRKARLLDGQMDETEMAKIQAEVDACHEEFKAHVLKHRKVSAEHLNGEVYGGKDAFAIGLIDGLADSADDLKILLNNGGIR
ncbi:protease [Fibrobacteria bacterium R8-3-H12]